MAQSVFFDTYNIYIYIQYILLVCDCEPGARGVDRMLSKWVISFNLLTYKWSEYIEVITQ